MAIILWSERSDHLASAQRMLVDEHHDPPVEWLRPQAHDVAPTDPTALLPAAGLLLLAAAVAIWVPSRRALPMTVLRDE